MSEIVGSACDWLAVRPEICRTVYERKRPHAKEGTKYHERPRVGPTFGVWNHEETARTAP